MAMAKPERQLLRVAAVWGTTVLQTRVLAPGESFRLGDDAQAAFPIPDGVVMSAAPLRAAPGGWELDPQGALSGLLRLRGRDEDPTALAATGASVAVMPGDHGLLQYGLLSIFFQYTKAPPNLGGALSVELLVLLALMSSGVLHFGVLGVLRTLMTPPQIAKPLELTNPEDLAARFGLRRAVAEVPPPPEAGQDKGGGQGDGPKADKKQKTDGEKIKGAEGKLGASKAHGETMYAGEIRPATSLGGISDVLNSATGEEIKHTLGTIQTVSSALNGMNAATTILGAGSGTGLHGAGMGGGGTGAGIAYGSGNIQTGGGNGGFGMGGSGGNGPGGSGGGRGGGNGSGNGSGNGGGVGERAIAAGSGGTRAGSGLTQEQIRRVVVAHQGALRACYEIEAQRSPNLRGGVTVNWHIDPGGNVTADSVGNSSLGNARVEGCILRQVKNWHFPTADAPSDVNYPFKFGVGT